MNKSKSSKPSKKSKPKVPERDFKAEVNEEFQKFIEYVPARPFARRLRSWLLEFLMYDGSMEVSYMQDLASDLDLLFDLLDKIEKVQGEIEGGE